MNILFVTSTRIGDAVLSPWLLGQMFGPGRADHYVPRRPCCAVAKTEIPGARALWRRLPGQAA